MKRLAGLATLAMVLSSTSGCGYFRDRGSDYLEARQTAPMRAPAGAQVKPLDPLLPVPRQVAALASLEKTEVPRPQPLQIRASDFSLQKSGESRWVLAQRSPAEVWPLARQFFVDNGFRIADERPQSGEFSTAWQRYDSLPAALARRLSGRVAVAAPDAQTRVRVRIEPGVQRNTSEVFVVSVERPAGMAGHAFLVEPDRRAAIARALAVAQAGDIVLVAGKGHETYQEANHHITAFDDRAEVRSLAGHVR